MCSVLVIAIAFVTITTGSRDSIDPTLFQPRTPQQTDTFPSDVVASKTL